MSTEQFKLVDLPRLTYDRPRSRRSDPLSSKRAEASMRSSGTLRGQALLTLELVQQFPGKTSKELAKLGTLDRYQLARRLPELLEMEKVIRTNTGNEDSRWWAV